MSATAGLVCAGCSKAPKWKTRPVETTDGIGEIDLNDHPELATPGGMIAVQPRESRKPVLVMRIENNQFRVLSLRCPHMGCTVRWDNETQLLICPCHGSRFDDRGRLLEGPAKASLRELPSQAQGTKVHFKLVDG